MWESLIFINLLSLYRFITDENITLDRGFKENIVYPILKVSKLE